MRPDQQAAVSVCGVISKTAFLPVHIKTVFKLKRFQIALLSRVKNTGVVWAWLKTKTPQCGHSLTAETHFCAHSGVNVSADTTTCPPTPARSALFFCGAISERDLQSNVRNDSLLFASLNFQRMKRISLCVVCVSAADITNRRLLTWNRKRVHQHL